MATGIRSDSNPIRIGIESDCKGLQRIAIRAVGLVPRHAPTAGPRMWFLVWNDLPGRGSQVHSPVGSRNPAGAYLKTCIVTTVYILIMGAIRSFDGRNCEWLIKYTRAVSGPYGTYSVATPWPACIKVVAVKPGRAVPDGLLLSPSRSVKAHFSGDGHAKIASWRPCWLIKYTRAVSVQYVQYSVGTPWPHTQMWSFTSSMIR